MTELMNQHAGRKERTDSGSILGERAGVLLEFSGERVVVRVAAGEFEQRFTQYLGIPAIELDVVGTAGRAVIEIIETDDLAAREIL